MSSVTAERNADTAMAGGSPGASPERHTGEWVAPASQHCPARSLYPWTGQGTLVTCASCKLYAGSTNGCCLDFGSQVNQQKHFCAEWP